jgi:diguanylate cyclase (GGDEF)-like protein
MLIVGLLILASLCAAGCLWRWQALLRREHHALVRSFQVVEADKRILALVARGASLDEVLDTLTQSIEHIASNCLCTILLLDPDGRRLLKGAGPSLPPEYMDIINGLEIGPEVGACGSAAFLNETAIVEDIATDYRFALAKDLLLGFGLRACWSVPIRNSRGAVLGTFAMYHRQPARPSDSELQLVETAAHLAGNAIERLRDEQRLADIAERLDVAEKSAHFGIWEADVAAGVVTLSSGLAGLVGWPATADRISIERLRQFVHPHDLPQLVATLAGAVEGSGLHHEFRIVLADGTIRWLRGQGHTEFEDGAPTRAIGALIDITRERQLLEQLRRESERLLALQHASTLLAGQAAEPSAAAEEIVRAAVELLHGDGGVLFRWNEAAGLLFPVQRWNLSEDVPSDATLPGQGFIGRSFLRREPVVANSHSVRTEPLSLPGRGLYAGLAVPLLHRGTCLGVLMVGIQGNDGRSFDADDARLASLFAGQVAAALSVSEALQQQRHAALHDALTGLPNRTLLNNRLEQAIACAERDDRSLALLLLDLDHFKEVNDTLGHAFGDELLQEVSRRLSGALRDSDTVARLGGDEFAVILPDADAEAARCVARQVLQSLKQPITLHGKDLEIEGSIGIAVYPDHGATSAILLRSADVAMYVAKGNRQEVAVYEHDAPLLELPIRLADVWQVAG